MVPLYAFAQDKAEKQPDVKAKAGLGRPIQRFPIEILNHIRRGLPIRHRHGPGLHFPVGLDRKIDRDQRIRLAHGIGAHTDYECFTLLHATAPGLEVLNGAGEWIEAPPLPGAFIVNIGDMLELLTNGEFLATTHRVRKVREERYSFPLFFNVDYATRIASAGHALFLAKYSPEGFTKTVLDISRDALRT